MQRCHWFAQHLHCILDLIREYEFSLTCSSFSFVSNVSPLDFKLMRVTLSSRWVHLMYWSFCIEVHTDNYFMLHNTEGTLPRVDESSHVRMSVTMQQLLVVRWVRNKINVSVMFCIQHHWLCLRHASGTFDSHLHHLLWWQLPWSPYTPVVVWLSIQ